MVIDIHSHIRRSNIHPETEEKILLDDMKRNGIDYRIVSSLEGLSTEENNQYISSLVSAHPRCLGGCAVINPKEADCGRRTEEALSLPGIMMLEMNSLEHGYYPDSCAGVEEVLGIVSRKNIAVKIFSGIGSRAMPWQWLRYVKKYPELPFVFLHMGCFDYGYGCVDLACEYPNIFLETSNQYEMQILKKALDHVPKEKLLFGSSYPERFSRCSLNIFDTFHIDESVKEAWLWKNAAGLPGFDGIKRRFNYEK